MQSEADTPAGSNGAPKGLPPVAPPSGRFIAQLFIVPGLIVLVGVFIYLGSSYLVRSSHTPESFLRDLDNPNPEVRWRGAHDLAQVLRRPESVALASDPKFALDLAERLDRAAAEVERAEQSTLEEIRKAEQSRKLTHGERDAYWRKLAYQRNHLIYLIACLGNFTTPVGAPVLSELAQKDKGPEIKGLTLRRRSAVWALANLGDNVKRRYLGISPRPEDKVLTKEQKDAALSRLKIEALGSGKRAAWARQALRYLEGGPSRTAPGRGQAAGLVGAASGGPGAALPALLPDPEGVDGVLARCAGADDPYLRSLVALALNFWDGPWVEPTLLRLAHDDGHGQRIEVTEAD